MHKVMTNVLMILTCDVIRNTKDGIRTISGSVSVQFGNEAPSTVASGDLLAFLQEEGLSPDAVNDQLQTARHYLTNNLKGGTAFHIQVTNGSRHWRILKKVKNAL